MASTTVYDEDVRLTKKVVIYGAVTFLLWLVWQYPLIFALIASALGYAAHTLLQYLLNLL